MMKRAFDFVMALLGLILLCPMFVLAAVVIKISSRGPILYGQTRVGLNGKHFKLYKFRTMITNADQLGSSVTTKNDARITPAWRILRRTKLDEIPQLWNVLVGDMSFVGPRPDVPGFADRLEGEDRIILSVRPGITGPATLKFRDEEDLLAKQQNPEQYNREYVYPEKVRLNRLYVENHSFWLDVKYILLTLYHAVPGVDALTEGKTPISLLPEPDEGPEKPDQGHVQ